MRIDLIAVSLFILFVDNITRPSELFAARFALPQVWANDIALERHLRRTRAWRLLGVLVGFTIGGFLWQASSEPDRVMVLYCADVFNAETRVADALAVAKDPTVTRYETAAEMPSFGTFCDGQSGWFADSQYPGYANIGFWYNVVGSLVGYVAVVAFTEIFPKHQRRRAGPASQAPLYRRHLGTYLPKFGMLAAATAAAVTVFVCLRTLFADLDQATTLWINAARGGKIAAALPLLVLVVGALTVALIIRAPRSGNVSAADLVLDDARRTEAVQRVVGASLIVIVPILRRLLELWSTGRHSPAGLAGSATYGFAAICLALWLWPAWVPRATYRRWRQWARALRPVGERLQ